MLRASQASRLTAFAQQAAQHLSSTAAAAAAATPPPSVGRLNHVAIAVPNVREAAAKYRDVLGLKVSEPQALPAHGVTVAFVDLGNTKLELLEPLGAASPIAKFLDKNAAGGIHHICLEVEDIQASAAHAARGARLLDPQPKPGAHGTPVVFLHPKDMCGVLTELEEVKR
ncbi:hypothetical protein COHA_007685 [Chlorella ohadii]|uniref:Methylmalonyl-CoA epimerase, mitochondrial n=1 Tax=Chlorella ohadii TaxID=2649997 RepID=A0AAD5DIY4_9CHLO|nr:hypothetical protein COHA_007685 [Chlorella ohadii]